LPGFFKFSEPSSFLSAFLTFLVRNTLRFQKLRLPAIDLFDDLRYFWYGRCSGVRLGGDGWGLTYLNGSFLLTQTVLESLGSRCAFLFRQSSGIGTTVLGRRQPFSPAFNLHSLRAPM
jgi:hypothetical protein